MAAKDFEISNFQQGTWNRYLRLGFVSAHIPWNTLSNLELWQSYKALRSDLVLPFASTPSNICPREYVLTVAAINNQLLSRTEVGVALDGLTSPNKLAITSVIADFMDRNWTSREIQLAFDEVDCLFISGFNSFFRIMGQGPTYWSNAPCASEGPAWSFWAYRWPVAWNYDW